MRSMIAALCAATALSGAVGAHAAPVSTALGQVDGVTVDGVTSYEAIPFAAPPVGPLRWRPPAPAAPWTGVRSATQFAPACMQASTANALLGIPALPVSEDCLYLNVWTPPHKAGERLPVLVWIYGGGFTSGATAIPTYSGESLARKGVVVVSIAYRLGAFGFLAHPVLSAESGGHGSGDYGLLDQIAGLQWIKQNIAAFGGDPSRVAIFGESAGGIAVSMLAASPRAKGLFQRAISESGGSFAPSRQANEGGENVPTLAAAEAKGSAFLASMGATTLDQARALPAEAIEKAAGPALGGFWPTADGDVIPGDQYLQYQAGKYNDTPVLIGTNADEGALFIRAITASAYLANVHALYGAYADRILAAYPGGSDAQALRSSRDLMRDTAFAWQTWAWARLQSRSGKGKVYVYYFNHRPHYPDLPSFQDWGASHGSEIAYVFGHLDPKTATPEDRAISDALQTYWANFARSGDPNGAGAPVWPAFTEANAAAMHFDNQPNAGTLPNLDKLKVLEGYYAWRRAGSPPAP